MSAPVRPEHLWFGFGASVLPVQKVLDTANIAARFFILEIVKVPLHALLCLTTDTALNSREYTIKSRFFIVFNVLPQFGTGAQF